MVEHVPCSFFSWNPFLGSEGEATSLQIENPMPGANRGCKKRAPVNCASDPREGLQGTSPVFLPDSFRGQ